MQTNPFAFQFRNTFQNSYTNFIGQLQQSHNIHRTHTFLSSLGNSSNSHIKPDLLQLGDKDIKYIQSVIVSPLFYVLAVDSTILASLSSLSSEQTKATATTMDKVHQLLDYVAKHPNACVMYKYSNMQLVCHSDASYLSINDARSRAGGHFFYLHIQITNQMEPFMGYLKSSKM